MTKAEQGGDLFCRDPLHLASTIEEAVAIHRREAERKGLRFEVQEDPNGTPATVTGDRARLRQVISNLVGNAVKHTSEGLIHVHWGEERLPEGDTDDGMTEDFARYVFPTHLPAPESRSAGLTSRPCSTYLTEFSSPSPTLAWEFLNLNWNVSFLRSNRLRQVSQLLGTSQSNPAGNRSGLDWRW